LQEFCPLPFSLFLVAPAASPSLEGFSLFSFLCNDSSLEYLTRERSAKPKFSDHGHLFQKMPLRHASLAVLLLVFALSLITFITSVKYAEWAGHSIKAAGSAVLVTLHRLLLQHTC
jgi:hypothetical protein